jgi:hypothetical protein
MIVRLERPIALCAKLDEPLFGLDLELTVSRVVIVGVDTQRQAQGRQQMILIQLAEALDCLMVRVFRNLPQLPERHLLQRLVGIVH